MQGKIERGATKPAKRPRVLILGIGNRLLRDEGVGSCFAEALASLDLPEWLKSVDGGIGGLSLVHDMEGFDVLFIVDALSQDEGSAGEAKLFKVNPDAIDPKEALNMVTQAGSHGIVPEILIAAASAFKMLPPMSYVVGIVPETIDLGDYLSLKAIEGCVKALSLIKGALKEYDLEININVDDMRRKILELCGSSRGGANA